MIYVRIEGFDDAFRDILADVKATSEALKAEVGEVGLECSAKMRAIIVENKKRPQADEPTDLEKGIYTDYFDDGWGVGDIEYLNENVGYWAAVNWGSDHMVGRRVPNGYFSPGQPNPTPDAFRQGRWKAGSGPGTDVPGEGDSSQGHWSFVVTNPIPPMNYIEKTSDWLDGRLDQIKTEQ